jgi:dipeptidyl aminopeptidase/acylaminoacyl peptidase
LRRCVYVCLLGLSVSAGASYGNEKDGRVEDRRVTVADAIQMIRWADHDYFLGGDPDGRVGLFSPDGKQFIVVVKKGNIERNTNEYSLLLFQTSSAFQSPKPQVLLTMSSSSNRDAISRVRWLDDDRTVVFLGENPGTVPEVYSFDIQTKHLEKLTNHQTPILAYDITAAGEEIVYEAVARRTADRQEVRRRGVVITTQSPSDLMTCDCDPDRGVEGASSALFVQTKGRPSWKVSSSDFLTASETLSLSPTGRYALVAVYVRDVPESWAEYQERYLHTYVAEQRRPGTRSNVRRYMLLDIRSHEFTPLMNTPISWSGNRFAWAKDGNSLVLSGAYLPLDNADSTERAVREKKTFVVEIKLPRKEMVKISDAELTIEKWEPSTGRLFLEPKNGQNKLAAETYERNGPTWKRVPVTVESAPTGYPLDVTVEEDMNTPPRIVVSEPENHRKSILLDLNPQFAHLQFGRVEAISWKAKDGHTFLGGLYLPPDFRPGTRYPLVIQTHGFRKDRFWIDGPWSSAFAAQPLAARGIVVLQVDGSADSGDDLKYGQTVEEAPRQMAGYEGAVDDLDRRGLIDRSRVGIVGFSRTVFYVEYTLTHSKYEFTAATLADGVDGGYMNYFLWPNEDYVKVNGGPPVGPSLALWLKNSPGFNLDKVTAAVHLECYGHGSFLGGWEWFSGLSLLRKPVDYVWLPDGTHLLVKPWDRITSQQGDVDWFSFWLLGVEDPNPRKKERYIRWEGLRALSEKNSTKPDTSPN